MAQLSNQAFYDKWVPLLADNVFQDIDGARFEQLLADVRDTFASQANVATQPVAPAVNFDPMLRQLTATHLLGVSELEYNHNNGGFTAYAPVQVDDLDHGQGEWRFRVKAATGRNASQTTDSPLVVAKGSSNPAGPGKIKAADISDSTEAGRALLTATDVNEQRSLLDKFVILAGQYGIGQPRFEHVAGADGLHAYLLRGLASLAAMTAPPAPTDGQVDDTGDMFSFLPPAGYSWAQLKVAGLPNTTGAEWLSAANSYVQNGRTYVRVVGAVAKGGLVVYVGASGNVPDGQVLSNEADFTANNVVPLAPGALQVDFKVDNASLSPGDTLEFTAQASGGTALYQHSVQALNPDTGDVTVLGTASTATYVGTWPSVPAGVYLLTDTLSDSTGASLVSKARRVVIAAPGSGGGALVPATRTRLGGVRIGDGLEVAPDGLLSAEAQLQKANIWQEVGDYSAKGLKLPIGSFVNDVGRLFIRQVDVGQKHFTFGRYYSLAKDSLIQWKQDDFIGQDGDGDVGLARIGPGVLEVNTGTAGSWATLRVLDLVADAAPAARNTLVKLAGVVGDAATLLTAKKTSLVEALNEVLTRLPKPGLGLAQVGNTIGLTKTVKNIPMGPSVLGLISDGDGILLSDNDFQKGYLATGFLGVEEGVIIRFPDNSIPQFSGYYDAQQKWLRPVSLYQDPHLNTVPPGAVYVRFSFPAKLYPSQTFTLGRLPYVRSVNGAYPDADGNVLVQGGSGSSYTDALARAAQLNRVAPTGTTMVTFTAESPTDYVFYSGTFTVDVTSAVAGVVVFVELGAGATPPTLDPAVFELANGGSYVAGSRNEYAFRVTGTGKIHYALNQLA